MESNSNDMFVFLTIYYFDFCIGHYDIRASLFNEALNTSQYFVNMLTTIANATHTKFSDLPAVLFIDLCNRYLELLAYSCHDRFNHLAFLF